MSIRTLAPLLRGPVGAVACGHPLGVEAGVEAFGSGGSAMDAALAAAAVLSVVLPDACGIGGDAMILVREPDGAVVAFNGSGAAPAALVPPIPDDGPGTAAVPGAVAGWEAAHGCFGRLPFEAALRPARRLAADGFPLGEPLASALDEHRARLERWASGWEVLRHAGAPGSTLRQPRLGALLERITRDGAEALYRGEIAAAVARAALAGGAPLSASDLERHTTPVLAPLRRSYHGASIVVQPPVSQALIVLMALGALERAGECAPPDRRQLAIDAIEAAFEYRDCIAAEDAADRLLSLQLDANAPSADGHNGPMAGDHTTAVATADARGLVVSMLVSVFDRFGSATVVPEGGFLLNDRLKSFASDPASPNAPAPGRRPVHTLSPLLLESDERIVALATPGADGQVQTLLQLVDALVVDQVSLPEALHRPRWRLTDGSLLLEAGFPPGEARNLGARGHHPITPPAGATSFGAAVAAGYERATGTVFAANDSRRGTWAGVR
jgi:gamma-glutamyltranspeptidase / glutathione hydrolase